VGLVHFDQAQAFGCKLAQQRFHQRGFAGTARAGQQHVVGRAACQELARVLLDALFLFVDAGEICQLDLVRVRHGFDPAGVAALAPSESNRSVPVSGRWHCRQPRFQPRQHAFGARQ